MAALDLITLADFRAFRPVTQGTARDVPWAQLITSASRMIENELGRRVRYRAPAEVSGAGNILAATAFANGAIVGFSQPSSAGRTLIVTFGAGLTAGVFTVTGTVNGVAGTSKTFDVTDGQVQHGLDFFTAISAMSGSGLGGSGTVTVGSSLGYVEYHTIRDGRETVLPLEWPATLLEVNEDISRTYGTTTRLVANTDYILTTGGIAEPSVITRINGAFRRSWFGGWRSIKVVYSAGYKIADIPEEIQDVARRLVQLMAEEVAKGQIEVATWSNALGSGTRLGPATLTRAMREQLSAYRRYRMGSDTGERDFDLEAA